MQAVNHSGFNSLETLLKTNLSDQSEADELILSAKAAGLAGEGVSEAAISLEESARKRMLRG
jgi:hypothetical protein